MSQWHRTHPELAGTAADPWMANEGHRQAHDELVRTGVIDPPEQERDDECGYCGHRFHGTGQCYALDRWGPRPDQVHDPCGCDGGADDLSALRRVTGERPE